jgi:hypothetical protein
MLTTTRLPFGPAALVIPLFLTAAPAEPGAVATRSLTVQPAGPRGGEAGSKYFNVEGKKNGKYASYGLLTFPAPEAGTKAGKIEGLTLTLVQSIPSFARDGKVRFFLVDAARLDPEVQKFDEVSLSGLGDKVGGRHAVGAGEFKKMETGHADTFTLSLDESARKLVERRLGTTGEIHLLITPDDEDVAATYFGAGEAESERRPRLALKLASP